MTQRVPEFTAKYVVLTAFNANINLDDNYKTIFSFGNTCSLEAIQLKFDGYEHDIKIIVDGFTVLEFNLKDLYFFEGTRENSVVFYDNGEKLFYFKPSNPIQAKTSVLIQARATGGGWWGSDGEFKGSIVSLQHWGDL